jgi:phosphate transport system substrate-binding protein
MMAVQQLAATHQSYKDPKITADTAAHALVLLCHSGGPLGDDPDIAEASRRITSAEAQTCDQNGVSLFEMKLGSEVVVLARSKLYGPLNLTPHDVFLALAREVPDLAHYKSVANNFNRTWNQIDPALPANQIQFIGPPLNSPMGRALVELLIEPGCNTYPWLTELKSTDETRYNSICRLVRDDGVYVESDPQSALLRVQIEPISIGIFSLRWFESNPDTLGPVSLGGVAPAAATVADGTYPASRTLYVYANRYRFIAYPALGLVGFLGAYPSVWGTSPEKMDGALVPPDQAERERIAADLYSIPNLHSKKPFRF